MVWRRKRIDVEGRMFCTRSNFACEVCSSQNALPHPLKHFRYHLLKASPPPQTVTSASVFPQHLGYCHISGVHRLRWACFHACLCPTRLCHSCISTEVPREHLNGRSVTAVLLGSYKEPWTGAVGWTNPGKVPQKVILMCVFHSKTAEKKRSLEASLYPATWSHLWRLRIA